MHQKVVENSMDDADDHIYKMAGTESELLSHIKSRKLRYFGHIMRLPHDNTEGSVMTGYVEGT